MDVVTEDMEMVGVEAEEADDLLWITMKGTAGTFNFYKSKWSSRGLWTYGDNSAQCTVLLKSLCNRLYFSKCHIFNRKIP